MMWILLLMPSLARSLSLPLAGCMAGDAAFMLSTSRGVRVSKNGFFFYDSPVHLPGGHPCPRIHDGLCAHGNYSFMRCTAEPLTFAASAPPPLEDLWLAETPCGKSPSLEHFDLTACDLTHSDITILWSDNTVAVRYNTSIPYGPKAIIALIMVWLVINLGETVALLLDIDGSKPRNHITAGLCVALVALVAWYTPWQTWATLAEQWMYIFVIVYILAYSAYHVHNQNTINVIVGCLLLVTARYYETCETQYVAPFMFLIATRFFQKCLAKRRASIARLGFMALDVVMFAAQYTVGFEPAFRDKVQGPICACALLYSAWCLSRFVS